MPVITSEYKAPEMEGKTPIRCFTMLAQMGSVEFSLHRHSACEIAIITEGIGEYTVRQSNKIFHYPFESGTVFLFGSYEAHLITRVVQPVKWIVLHIEPYFIWNPNNTMYDSKQLKVFFDRSYDGTNRLDYPEDKLNKICNAVYEIKTELQEQKSNYLTMLLACVQRLLILLSRLTCPTVDIVSGKKDGHYLKRIQNAYDYMNKNYLNTLNIEEIARQANMSTSHFSAVFRECNGVSPWEYIIIKRIKHAMHLLLDEEDESILNIALKSGFENTANFNKAFKRIAGCTPSAFRKRHPDINYFT